MPDLNIRRKRLSAFVACANTAKIILTTDEYTVFEAVMDRDEFTQLATVLDGDYRLAYHWQKSDASKAWPPSYIYTIIVQERTAPDPTE